MSCHGDDKENQRSHKHNSMKHLLHMAVCCGLPILIIGLLSIISRVSPAASAVLEKIVPFLCPIMMMLMIPMMFRDRKGSCCDNKYSSQVDSKLLELNKSAE